jgi:hypothetical protein
METLSVRGQIAHSKSEQITHSIFGQITHSIGALAVVDRQVPAQGLVAKAGIA